MLAKTVTYDGSLTGGERDINAYRVLITDSVGTLVADSGLFSSDELTLTGIAPGSYTAMLQGVINGGGESVVVAENEYPITVKGGDRLSMTLDSVAEGYAGEVALSVDLHELPEPYGGTASMAFHLSFDYESGNDGGVYETDLQYRFDDSVIESDENGWHVDMLLASGTVPSGKGILTITMESGSDTYNAVASFCLYPDIKAMGDINLRSGVGVVKPEFINIDPPDFEYLADISSIAYGNGKFIAIHGKYPSGKGLMESTDGINWTEIETTGFPSSADTIRYINDRFFVEDLYLYWSKDGREWVEAKGYDNKTINNISYGRWVYLDFEWTDYDDFENSRSSVYSLSSDLVTWSEPALAILGTSKYVDPEIKGFLYAENRFVAVDYDNACYSSNGTSWTALPDAFGYGTDSLVYGASYFLAYGNRSKGQLYRSSSGTSWSEVTDTDLSTISINDICYGSRFVAVGDDGEIRYGTSSSAWYDATVPADVVEDINAVAYGNGVYVAAGNDGVILRSTNGSSWSRVDISEDNPVRQVISETDYIAYGNGIYIAGKSMMGTMYSYDGLPLNWNVIKDNKGNNISYGIKPVYFHDIFVSGSLYSNDGVNWISASSYSFSPGNTAVLVPNSESGFLYAMRGSVDDLQLAYSNGNNEWEMLFDYGSSAIFYADISGFCTIRDTTFIYVCDTSYISYRGLLKIDSTNSVTEISIEDLDIFDGIEFQGMSQNLGDSWSLVVKTSENILPGSFPLFCSSEDYVIAMEYDGDFSYTVNGIDWHRGGNVGVGRVSDLKFSDDRFVVCGDDGIAYWVPEAS